MAYYYDVTGRNELYVLDVETGAHRRVSDGEVPRDATWFLRWDATGDRIYFQIDDAGDEHTDHAHSTDGRYLLYASDERDRLTDYDRPVWGAQVRPRRHTDRLRGQRDRRHRQPGRLRRRRRRLEPTPARRREIGAETYVRDWHPDGDRL